MSSFSNSQDIRVGIVDDSALIRQMIEAVVSETPNMKVVGTAADPYDAREMIKATNPDVITLDVEMPKMNGIEFLDKIMKLRPMPVIMVSTLTQRGADITVQALEMGAIDYVAKPVNEQGKLHSGEDVLNAFRTQLVPKLKSVKSANFRSLNRLPKHAESSIQEMPKKANKHYQVIGIASSTGGIERLRYLLSHIKVQMPPIVIVQHINRNFVDSMVSRLQTICPPHLTVKTAEDKERLQDNSIYIADNQKHLSVTQDSQGLKFRLIDEPPRNGFIASADYLFESLAQISGKKILGVIVSGMGSDGAKGLLKLKQSHADTVGESESSCLVYGMPRAAQQLGALKKQMSIQDILATLNGLKTV